MEGYWSPTCGNATCDVGENGNSCAADCGTLIPLSTTGGLVTVVAQVGACSRTDCVHNSSLECTAQSVRVGPGEGSHHANCLTYQPR